MFIWPIIILKRLLFLSSCKDENEIPLNCLSGLSKEDIEFDELSRFFNSSSKLLFKLQLLSYVPFKCSVDHQRFRNFCKKFNSSLFLTFLLRCRPFLPSCSLLFTLSIKSASSCPKYLLKLDKVRTALVLSIRIVGLDTITLQGGHIFVMYCFSWINSSRICLDVFKTVSFVPICSLMCSGFFLGNGTRWCFRSSIVAPLKYWTFTF